MTPRRIQQHRTKGWRKPEGAVAVGRGTKWGNPFRPIHCDRRLHYDGLEEFPHPHWHLLADDLDVLAARWGTKAEAIEWAVKAYRMRTILQHEEIRTELAGKDLMCWCPLDAPCHADVLLELANGDPQ